MGPLIAIALKSLIVAGAALLILRLAHRRSAADRSLIAHFGLGAMLLLPLGSLLLPPLGVSGPAFLAAEPAAPTNPSIATSPLLDGPSQAMPASTIAEAAPGLFAGIDPVFLLYLLPALILALLTVAAVGRLMVLKGRASVLIEPQWITALAHAQRRMGFKHGTALLTSNELPSPVSWGVMRPVILLNEEAAGAHDQAEAVIAHELAHVAHLDWAKLLLARVVVALFWFNPLAWLLSREAHQLREEAADDAVLAADIDDTDYAQLLVGVARHECRGFLLGAHGVAPAKNSLARRVRRVLDGALERAPGGWRWTSAAAFFAAGMAVPLAALTVISGAQPAAAGVPATRVAAVEADATSPRRSDVVAAVEPIVDAAPSTDATRPVGAPPPTTKIATAPGDAVLHRPDGTVMVASKSGRAVMYGPDGRTYVAEADGTATVYQNGKAVASAHADGARADASAASRIDQAIAKRALGVDKSYASAIRSAMPGVRISERDLVQLKALGVTRDYIRAMSAVGYRNLDVPMLTQLSALRISPSDVARAKRAVGRLPTPEELSGMRAVGVEPEDFDPDDGG